MVTTLLRGLRIFRATEAEAVVFHLGVKKTAVEGGGAESASVRQTVEPRPAFQHPFVFTVLRFRDGVAGVGQVVGVHPLPHVPRHIV